jgi:hypothetical protein
LHFYIFGPKV